MQGYIPQISIDQNNLELKIIEAKRLIDKIEHELGIFAWEPSEDASKADVLHTRLSALAFPSNIKKESMPVFPEFPSNSINLSSKPSETRLPEAMPPQQPATKVVGRVLQGGITAPDNAKSLKGGPQTPEQQHQTVDNTKNMLETTKNTDLAQDSNYSDVKDKLKQLEDMKATVELLRQNLEGMKSSQVNSPQIVQVTKPAQDYSARQQAPQVAKAEIENLNLLIRKLNELVNTNLMVASELREIINETRSASKSTRISELMRRLAEASING